MQISAIVVYIPTQKFHHILQFLLRFSSREVDSGQEGERERHRGSVCECLNVLPIVWVLICVGLKKLTEGGKVGNPSSCDTKQKQSSYVKMEQKISFWVATTREREREFSDFKKDEDESEIDDDADNVFEIKRNHLVTHTHRQRRQWSQREFHSLLQYKNETNLTITAATPTTNTDGDKEQTNGIQTSIRITTKKQQKQQHQHQQ